MTCTHHDIYKTDMRQGPAFVTAFWGSITRHREIQIGTLHGNYTAKFAHYTAK